ncbi:preprotein translocase subunit SecE [Heliophilum fasciatum]|uniref:Protein translocase subunit SecE n=1 Tax=Heliophilum fasciatum TaxID=35700 RepID=A0A4R2RQI7_9FIRM|nr:preprotein translocase subunit SecE [Heliophilum fasciatum]MCW2277830.1 preprotein translocase subunit SecE [Heliophilum fasciatum]TCP64677.1 preprotein translocase subunit SecE [Heliophilum fasciatum]
MGELKKLDRPERTEKGDLQAKAVSTKETVKKAEPAKDVAKKTESAKKPVPASSDKAKSKNFAKGVVSEVKKVHWPTKDEVVTYTGVVLASVVVVAALIFVIDSALGLALKQVIK